MAVVGERIKPIEKTPTTYIDITQIWVPRSDYGNNPWSNDRADTLWPCIQHNLLSYSLWVSGAFLLSIANSGAHTSCVPSLLVHNLWSSRYDFLLLILPVCLGIVEPCLLPNAPCTAPSLPPLCWLGVSFHCIHQPHRAHKKIQWGWVACLFFVVRNESGKDPWLLWDCHNLQRNKALALALDLIGHLQGHLGLPVVLEDACYTDLHQLHRPYNRVSYRCVQYGIGNGLVGSAYRTSTWPWQDCYNHQQCKPLALVAGVSLPLVSWVSLPLVASNGGSHCNDLHKNQNHNDAHRIHQ